MSKIERMTPAQVAAMKPHADAWITRALECRPADRARAERGIRAYYRLANLAEPRVIVWVEQGPFWAMWACGLVEKLLQIGRAQVGAQVWAQVWDQVGDQVWDQVGAQVRAQVGAQVWDQKITWREYIGGAWWAYIAAYGAFARDALGCTFNEALSAAEDTSECGWWIPHRDFVVVSDRPMVLSRDERGRMHSATGPSIAYGDAWSLHHWHGTAVPAEWIERPETLTPAMALSQTQIELRTAACEIVGWEKILAGLPHRVLATDPDPEIGTLISVDLPDAPDTRYVRARCGTSRMIHYRAAREAKTPLEAAARSYRLKASEYKPEVRT